MRSRLLAIVVLIATLTFMLSPLLASGFNGFTADQFPVPQDNPPVQPEGYAFAIWGLIYLWLLIGAVYGVVRAAEDRGWQAMRIPLAISLILGSFWIKAANEAPILATGMIVVMAAAAIAALLRASEDQPWLQVRPVALYAGWLTAATGVAIGVLLGGYGIVSAQAAAINCLCGVLAVALIVQSARPREWAYPAAVIWALIGIIVANLPSQNLVVIALAALGIVALAFRAGHSLRTGAV
ncbi:tryptophan-rich sensory protein [Antarcticimicrobium sediminis]|uniref:Uncharacterized protein n=1 Tax=Antarcticimicrobium sediminis TaxID=2546227 RepID=A0A4R5F1D4_9RHOB|nr:tryptophan-rich sensory protein [Antarcticimicrobium sediminis]TDE41092.1 hypothetical protein E1B25_02450 [Antarcticimicrobium sediminis]